MDRSQSKYFHTAVKMDEALIALLNEKDFEYITIKEICQKAGVNRSTFYLHYENTRDLLEETVRYLIDRFRSYFPMDEDARVQNRFRDCALEELNYISEDYLVPYLTYIQENRKVFAIALAHAGNFEFDAIYQKMFRHIFQPILDRFRFPAAEQPYVMAFYLNGITAIMTQWVRNDCQDSIETICGILKKCILGKLQGRDFISAIE